VKSTPNPRLYVGQRVRFFGERHSFTVRAVSPDGRWAACTKPDNLRHSVLYTVVDCVARVRGVDNSTGNSLGYETREECERAVALFHAGDFEFSHRRRPIPLRIEHVREEALRQP
jgi:hypothetical protein